MTDADSLESILADMHKKYVEGSDKPSTNLEGDLLVSKEKQRHPTLDKLLNELKQDFKVNPFPTQAVQTSSVKKNEKQSLNPELNRLVIQQKEDNQKMIRQKAQQWLDQLDPLSGEGIWFTDLAKHYPSPLAAAIDLLASGSV